jgi:hypothetical protein
MSNPSVIVKILVFALSEAGRGKSLLDVKLMNDVILCFKMFTVNAALRKEGKETRVKNKIM